MDERYSGFYYPAPYGIGSGYSNYFALFPDGRWVNGNDYPCAEEGPIETLTLRRSGIWRVEGNRLVLRQLEKVVHVGGECRADAIECVPQGGTRRRVAEEAEIVVDLAAPGASGSGSGAPAADPDDRRASISLRIEGTCYFNLGRAEDYLEPPVPEDAASAG